MSFQTLFDTAKDDRRATLLAGGIVLLSLSLFGALFLSTDPQLLRLLSLGYLGVSVTLGFWLYASNPPLYLGFVFWIWFLSPLVRRLVDFQLGTYTPTSHAFPLLVPFLVTGICALDLPRYGRLLLRRSHVPFLLCLIGIVYGLLVGLPKVGSFSAMRALLEWLVPLLLGFHVAATWRLYPAHRRVLRSTFVGATLLLGIYGVIQFFFLPGWDALWMRESGMHSIGRPVPLEVRVFSTLNAPGPFATILIPGLLLAAESRGVWAKLSFLPGMISFLLAIVRSAWGGWVLGFGYLLWQLRGVKRLRLLAVVLVLGTMVVPFALTDEITERTSAKLETLQNLENDHSLQEREYMYRTVTLEALMNPIGEGLGSGVYDSGFVTILWQLGWFGGFLYLGGLTWILWTLVLRPGGAPPGSFETIVLSIIFAYFGMMIFGRQILEVVGCAMWTFIGLAFAARRHRSNQPETPPDAAAAATASIASSPDSSPASDRLVPS